MKPSLTLETIWFSTLRAICLGVVLLGFLPSLRAQQFGLFTYEKVGNTVEITGYPRDAVGAVEIPAVIDGLPVTGIRGHCFPEGGVPVVARASARAIKTSPGNRPAEIPWCGYNDDHPGAFAGCTGLTSITIPSSVKAIGNLAFSGCTGLTSVTLPSSLVAMGNGVFSGCTGLTRVILEKGLTTIGWDTFDGCTKLESFEVEPGNTVYFSDGGVLLNAAQTAVLSFPFAKAGHYSIPSSVTSIGWSAFSGCTRLTSVSLPSSVTSIGGSAFFGCTGLTSVTIPNGVTHILDWTFSGCSGLTNVTIPNSVTRIGSFLPPPRPDPNYSGPYVGGAFAGCAGLTSITLPNSLRDIGYQSFAGCTGLTNVTIPAGVRHIDYAAFSDCTGLTSVTIPSSVSWIASFSGFSFSAFSGCTGLESFVVEPGNTNYASDGGVLLNGTQTELIQCPARKVGLYTIPSSVASIGVGAFSGCSGLTNITLPTSLTTIASGAFRHCAGLTSVTIPASVTYIGWSAFSDCPGLTRVLFLSNAPGMAGANFANSAPGFTIYYLSSRAGFTSPTWNGYPATMINEATYPAAPWLLTHGLGYDSDLNQDPDGDGVNLLTGYALNLDPRLNLQGRLPGPVLGADTLSLNFHASSPGVTYRVETSTNLTDWTTAGVTQSTPGADGRSTASVLRDETSRFLRLVVQD